MINNEEQKISKGHKEQDPPKEEIEILAEINASKDVAEKEAVVVEDEV